MLLRFRAPLCAAVIASAVVACDDDPSGPAVSPRLAACPTAPLLVNQPITLNFDQPLNPSTLSAATIAVTQASGGGEIQGSLALTNTASGSQVVFTPSTQLPYGDSLRIRVQNLRADVTNQPVEFRVCTVMTEPPPIAELFWRQLPAATGNNILGVSVVAPDRGFIAASSGAIFRRDSGDFIATFSSPYLLQPTDIAFIDRNRGFASYTDQRSQLWRVLESVDGGLTFDTIAAAPQPNAIRRILFRATGPGANDVFGVVGGGTGTQAMFGHLTPAGRTFNYQVIPGTANVADIDFATDRLRGVGVTSGIRIGAFFSPGKVFVTSTGGTAGSWTEVPGTTANTISVGYFGTAIRESGEIWVTGFAGYILRLTPSGGSYTVTRVHPNLVANADSTQPNALIYTDIQFLRNNDQRGFLIGQQQVGVVNGSPRFRGFIFETRNGGATWTRQGVQGAPGFGGDFEAVTRISISPDNSTIWIGGARGAVLEYKP